MTREEAIEVLKMVKPVSLSCRGSGKRFITIVALAVDMGIAALEQERVLDKLRAEIEQEPYVSKMEVLDIIDEYKAESEVEK